MRIKLASLLVLVLVTCFLVSCFQPVSAQSAATFSLGFTQTTINQALPVTLVVNAKDAANNTVTSYNSPIYVTFSDSAAIIPANQSLSLNKGVGNFTVYFGSTGTQSITVSDPTNIHKQYLNCKRCTHTFYHNFFSFADLCGSISQRCSNCS